VEAIRELERLAGAQHWLVARRQLSALGVSRRAVEHRLTTGYLRRVHHGVYLLGRAQLDRHGRWHAAVLAYGPTAVLSHRSAAALWGLVEGDGIFVDVTVPGPGRRRRQGIWVRRTRVLTPDDATVRDNIPVTTVARTLVDLSGLLTKTALKYAVEQADRLRLLDVPATYAALERVTGRRNLRKLRRILARYGGAPPVRSKQERFFLELVERAGLPTPLVNTRVEGIEVDIFWPQWRLVVELDGRGYHSDPDSFENDRLRDARLQKAGYRVLRVTYRRLHRQPRSVIADIRSLAALG
jgi:hypothetical protein